jgi:hypothetical protein
MRPIPAFLCIALMALSAAGQTKDDLVGTWRLVAAWTTRPSGERVPDYGAHPVGFLTYTREGRMTVVVGDGDRKALSGDRLSAPASERAEAFSNFLAYAGSYTFNGERVVHHVEASSIQNWVNTDQVRGVKLDGDRLTLSASNMLGGEQRLIELVWQRLK